MMSQFISYAHYHHIVSVWEQKTGLCAKHLNLHSGVTTAIREYLTWYNNNGRKAQQVILVASLSSNLTLNWNWNVRKGMKSKMQTKLNEQLIWVGRACWDFQQSCRNTSLWCSLLPPATGNSICCRQTCQSLRPVTSHFAYTFETSWPVMPQNGLQERTNSQMVWFPYFRTSHWL